MARKFGTAIDLMQFELQNAKVHNLGSAPTGLTSGEKGLLYFNTATNRLFYWDGSAWVLKASDADLLGGQNSAYHLARGNHSGTQTSGTISDLAATVKAYRLDEFANGTNPITASEATLSTHLTTKGQLDTAIAALSSGQVPKGAVKAAALTNINIASAPATIDGITPDNGDIFLLTAQSTTTQNGPRVWTSAGAAMARAVNWNSDTEAVLGSYWIVLQGSKADQFALLTNDTAITLDTTVPAFTFISASGAAYIGGDGLTLTGDTFDVGEGVGIDVTANAVAIDTAVVLRKVMGIIPVSTTGIFTVAGAVVTVNHALGNKAARPHVVYHTSPGGGNTEGDPLEVQYNNSDTNNTILTLPGAPASNQYYMMIDG